MTPEDRARANLAQVEAVRLADGRELPMTGIPEEDHYITCQACGQAIDCRRLGDVFHHEEPGHERLVLNS